MKMTATISKLVKNTPMKKKSIKIAKTGTIITEIDVILTENFCNTVNKPNRYMRLKKILHKKLSSNEYNQDFQNYLSQNTEQRELMVILQ